MNIPFVDSSSCSPVHPLLFLPRISAAQFVSETPTADCKNYTLSSPPAIIKLGIHCLTLWIDFTLNLSVFLAYSSN